MKIPEALNLIFKKSSKTKKITIGSESAGMHAQTPKTLLFWVMTDPDTQIHHKIQYLIKILTADNWEIE